ncbi:hypothetical protein J437_LFUL009418 [Ladona fulva]|uniref:Uncharacterized protein n=1 Tax=Ladona fulva TaxID=123851 RepID=A0A8K0KDR3_LADFU|nr:hypothetical protein J437_LFUL009418 [Ladona fulva]
MKTIEAEQNRALRNCLGIPPFSYTRSESIRAETKTEELGKILPLADNNGRTFLSRGLVS